MKHTIRRLILLAVKPLRPLLELVFSVEAYIAKKWVASSHNRLFLSQWGFGEPEWFDHSIDLYYQWSKTGEGFWVERGVYSAIALKGGDVLELCCGDGFNAKHFYSNLSRSVVSCDFDESAIKTAKRKNTRDNVEFILADIRKDMPKGQFQNIVWDAAIEHFTEEEIARLLASVKSRLTSDGILSGYTIVEKDDGVKSLHQHEYEFQSKADLKAFLVPHFKNVTVFETIYNTRHNLYFWASDSVIPFSGGWQSMDTNLL